MLSRIEAHDRNAEITISDSEGRVIRVRVGSVIVGTQEVKPVIWIDGSVDPVLVTPEVWQQLVSQVEKRLVRPARYS
jgi:hypothetical protein